MKRQMIKELNPQAIFLDNAFDIAIVGVGSNKFCIDIISSDGVDDKEASMLLNVFVEHSTGKYSPIFLTEMWEIA